MLSNKTSFNTSNAQSQSIIRESKKLLTIPAPTFNGDLQNWVLFLDSFNAMYYYNQGLSGVQRLHYSKLCIIGPAAEVSYPKQMSIILQLMMFLLNIIKINR